MLRGEGVTDHIADVMGDEIGCIDLETIEDPCDVVALGFLS
jgi:hypothetical protein